ncbi:hypothetical protein QA601_04295 [Chitinispirillales bacterium ANBcel5]|uniref:hypothetical protein n=1 Tax=Cellulosispirillum alkaliphilum TaxID=3039283 RepID=UPI002A5327B4|nr:hypothetical protein [Chitinispirillales bacterium ANBcel5]
MGYSRTIFFTVFCLIPLLIQCNLPTDAGGETINERTVVVYLNEGRNLAPDTDITIGSTLNDSVIYTGLTNKKGEFVVPKLNSGLYAVFFEKQKNGKDTLVAFQNSVFISPDKHSLENDTLRNPGVIGGVIQFPEYDNTPENLRRITVHILGTIRNSNVGADGSFLLTNVAPGSQYNIKINPNRAGYTTQFLNDIVLPLDKNERILDTIYLKLDSIAPVEIKGLSYDSLNGVVQISWNPALERISYYEIFRYSINKSTDQLEHVKSYSRDTVFSDTLFSLTENEIKMDLDDTSVVKLEYRVEAVNERGERSIFYFNKEDTISVRSPWPYRSTFTSSLIDSATGQSISRPTVNRTAGFTYTIENEKHPFKKVRLLSAMDTVAIDFDSAVTVFSDTLYLNRSRPGEEYIIVEVYDSLGNRRIFCGHTTSITTSDLNYFIADFVSEPKNLIIGEPIGASGEIGYETLMLHDHDTLSVTLYLDDKQIGYKDISLNAVSPARRIPFTFDPSETESAIISSPGTYELKLIVKNSLSVFETDTSDNVQVIEIEVTDLDLKISRVVCDPQFPFDGDRIRCGAWIRNDGTSDFENNFHSKVKFEINRNEIPSGYFYNELKSGDSVLVWSSDFGGEAMIWRAKNSPFTISASLILNDDVPNRDTATTSKSLKVDVSDFNLKLENFDANLSSDMTAMHYSALVRSEGLFSKDHPNFAVDSFPLSFYIEDELDTMILISLDELLQEQRLEISVSKEICICDFDLNTINFRAVLNPDTALKEITYDDNSKNAVLLRRAFDINGNFDRLDQEGNIDGWIDTVVNGVASLRHNRNGLRTAYSRTVSIVSYGGGHAVWKHPIDITPTKTYKVSGWVLRDNIDQDSSEWPPVSIGFYGTGHILAIPETGSHDWTYFCGLITPDGLVGRYYISCNLGFDRIGSNENNASGRVSFDDIRVEYYE